jgi:hypothetical protein
MRVEIKNRFSELADKRHRLAHRGAQIEDGWPIVWAFLLLRLFCIKDGKQAEDEVNRLVRLIKNK